MDQIRSHQKRKSKDPVHCEKERIEHALHQHDGTVLSEPMSAQQPGCHPDHQRIVRLIAAGLDRQPPDKKSFKKNPPHPARQQNEFLPVSFLFGFYH